MQQTLFELAHRLDALGAQGLLYLAATFPNGNLLQVRAEEARGVALGVRDVPAHHRLLAAVHALRHGRRSFANDG